MTILSCRAQARTRQPSVEGAGVPTQAEIAVIRTIQRRVYGLRDEEYLALKILTFGLPEL